MKKFMFWDSGFQNAPELVKICSQRLQSLEDNVILLDKTNYELYIPKCVHSVLKKLEDTVSIQHWSDLLILELLIEHGGIWIDSTVLLVKSFCQWIPSALEKAPLFFYTREDIHGISNWFIATKESKNRTLILLRNLFVKELNDTKQDNYYFKFHRCYKELRKENNLVQQEYDDMEKISSITEISPHTCQVVGLDSPITDENKNKILNPCIFMHKLNHRSEIIPHSVLDFVLYKYSTKRMPSLDFTE